MLIDTHTHLNYSDFDPDRRTVIGNAKKAGVKKFIVPGVDFYSSGKSVELAQQFPGVIYASIGFHPYEAQKNPDLSFMESRLSYASPATLVAIGECGLDYHLYQGEPAVSKKDRQKILFEQQLKLALKNNLPVIIHCRDAFDDLFNVLDCLSQIPRGVIHCFSGGLLDIRMAKKRGLFIGIDGNVTYSKHLQNILPHIPLSMILLETDSPLLTPAPHRGKRNEPKFLTLVAKKIAEQTNIGFEEIKKQTTSNALSLFHFS